MGSKQIGIEIIFGTAKIQLRFRPKNRIIVRNFQKKINGTLRELWFFIKINPVVILRRNKSPVMTHGRNYPYLISLKLLI